MKYFVTILSIILCTQSFAYNPFWIQQDKKIIAPFLHINKFNAKEVEQHFIQLKCDTVKQNLGFGWKMWKPSLAGGYFSISSVFYYFNDSIVSYSVIPRLPEENRLQKRYKNFFNGYFSDSANICPTKINEQVLHFPLKEYCGNLKSIPLRVAEYMAPSSGTMYGQEAGGMIMQNRAAFLKIQDSLTNDELEYILYSINPASRFTAIEYYLKNRNRFSSQLKIDEWVEQNFVEIPKIETMRGCIGIEVKTKDLFFPYLHYYFGQ